MTLPIRPPYEPMECRPAERIPTGAQWQYEPKWDGFRCLAFRDGNDVRMQSKSGQPLARYFPEVVALLQSLKPKQFVLDGELMIRIGDDLDFDALLQRIHPAASRVEKLAREMPAHFVVFDLLVDARGTNLTKRPLKERRERLEQFAKNSFPDSGIWLSPATLDLQVVHRWFERVGNALDGVVAKRRDLPYASGERDAAQKIKHYRSADCVVGGYRLNKHRTGIGSLLLGLYDAQGLLNHVGFTSGFKDSERGPLLARLKKLEKKPGFTGSAPGGPSRWTTSEEPWFPLAPKLVVEVSFDHASGHRFRHGTKILRWRPDKAPDECTMDQLLSADSASPLELLSI